MRLSLARRDWTVGWIATTALILAATLKAAEPALLGEWVYDDRALPVSSALDAMDDVRAAFSRSSEDYFAALRAPGSAASPPVATGVTYRPLPMASLSVVNAALGPEPLFHHMLSALFHIGCVLLLAQRFRVAGRLTWRGWFVVTAFAAHPCLVEAWGWINGRSDAMAGLALLALDASQRPRVLSGWHWALCALCLSAGVLCKETFIVAAAFVLLSTQLRREREGETTSRTWWASSGLWLVATAGMLTARHFITRGGAGSTEVDVSEAFASVPRLMSLALEALVIPRARSMRLLSWELATEWSMVQVVLSCAAVVGLAMLVRARRWAQLALLTGAGATLLPVLMIGGGFWFGFDRYLYMPAILIALACVPSRVDALEARPTSRWMVSLAYVGLSAILLLGTRTASAVYASQEAFERSMITLRPEDPSGYLNGFREAVTRGEQARARDLLETMPARMLPLPHAHRAMTAWLSLGEPERSASVALNALRMHDPEPRLLIGLARARAAQGRWDEACTLLERAYDATPIKRTAIVATLERTLDELARTQMPPKVSARLQALAARIHEAQQLL